MIGFHREVLVEDPALGRCDQLAEFVASADIDRGRMCIAPSSAPSRASAARPGGAGEACDGRHVHRAAHDIRETVIARGWERGLPSEHRAPR